MVQECGSVGSSYGLEQEYCTEKDGKVGEFDMTDRDKIIKELTNLPTTIYDGFYQLRITHDLRNKVIALLKEQQDTELCDRCGRRRLITPRDIPLKW